MTTISTQAVLPILQRASRVARAVQQRDEDLRAMVKDDRSPVTVADFAVQAVVADGLRELDPAIPLVGEEDSSDLGTPEQQTMRDEVIRAVRTVLPERTAAEILSAIDLGDHDGSAARYWTLDPIDGTKGFLRHQQYAIALGTH